MPRTRTAFLRPFRRRALHDAFDTWFRANARDLPWRAADCTAWGVLVSEIMLQQTPVVRVLPVWEEWLRRWPQPADLAREPAGEAVRAWGRLGYPRRALRLHAAAVAIGTDHGGKVPGTYPELLELPGVGSYTAAAVAAFAFGRRETVVDTNIRRVHARLFSGAALPSPVAHCRGDAACRAGAAGRRRVLRPLERRSDGTRRPGVHCAVAEVRAMPGQRLMRLARSRGAAADVHTEGPVVARN